MYGSPHDSVMTVTSASGITIWSIWHGNWITVDPGGGSANDGVGVTNGTFMPAAVMQSCWLQFGQTTANYDVSLPQLLISGLNPASVYTLRMTGSWTINVPDEFNASPSLFTVAGAGTSSAYVNENFNASDGAVFYNFAPDASGQIHLYINTTPTSNLAAISGLQIIEGATAAGPTVRLTSPVTGTLLPEDANITLKASATETGVSIAYVQFYADTCLLGTDSSAPYSVVWHGPDPGNYTITAKATDAGGRTSSASATVTVESLNYFWSTTGNIATSGDTFFVGTVDTNRLSFRTNNIERMTILNDGTVGIGTKNTYGYSLAVNGKSIFTKVVVKAAGTWPDYVFKKDYTLPTLAEVERYIRTFKHLPGIPSAGAIQADGLDLGDHQAALLKKVEELTLYLIDQNKSLAEQSRQLKEQNARLDAQQKQIDQLKALILANPKHD